MVERSLDISNFVESGLVETALHITGRIKEKVLPSPSILET